MLRRIQGSSKSIIRTWGFPSSSVLFFFLSCNGCVFSATVYRGSRKWQTQSVSPHYTPIPPIVSPITYWCLMSLYRGTVKVWNRSSAWHKTSAGREVERNSANQSQRPTMLLEGQVSGKTGKLLQSCFIICLIKLYWVWLIIQVQINNEVSV